MTGRLNFVTAKTLEAGVICGLMVLSSSSVAWADYESALEPFGTGDYVATRAECEGLAQQGDALCRVLMGQIYFYGLGVEKDEKIALDWDSKALPGLRKLAEAGNMYALEEIGFLHETGRAGLKKDLAMKFKYYLQAGKKGNLNVQYALGRMYGTGQGVAKDHSEAVKWYRKAAERGDATAQTNLGLMYADGSGVAENDVEAAKWFRKAAEYGNPWGQYFLAKMYRNGEGVAKDHSEAVKWYRKAAEQGHAAAQNSLGVIYDYDQGTGVTQDYAEAAKWYRKAAEQGLAEAQDNLGTMYYRGNGVAQDFAEGVRWYRKAAEQGRATAQNSLGIMYAQGAGVTQDDAEAVKWYRKAAEQGHAWGQNNLGLMYHEGKGVAKNNTEAAKWWRKAAEQGYAKAQEKLDELRIFDARRLATNYGFYQVVQVMHDISKELVTDKELNRAKGCIKATEATVVKANPEIDTDELWRIGFHVDKSQGDMMELMLMKLRQDGYTRGYRESALEFIQFLCMVQIAEELERQNNPNTRRVRKKDF